LAFVSPGKPTGFVSDFAGVLNAADKQSIEAKALALQRETGFQVAVATVPSLGDDTIEEYAVKLFEAWGIGNAKTDTGLLLLVAPNEHKVKIETGYGAEGAVTDIQAAHIIDEILLPAFKQGNYGAGISGAMDAFGAIITNSPEAAQYSAAYPSGSSNTAGFKFDIRWGFVLIIILINVFAKILGGTKSWWLGGVLGAIAGAIIGFIWGFLYIGIIAIVLLTIVGLLFDFIVSMHPPGSSGRGGFWPIIFGGGSGGSSSGGFGGFGGGSSGGGGASGSW
jgi:uncharacterized protein